MIQRVIEQRYQRLLATPLPTTDAPELLARTHALLLYQMILFFDEGISASPTARVVAEETISALSEAASALLGFAKHADEDDNEREDDDDGDDAEEEGDEQGRTKKRKREDTLEANPARNIPLYPLTAARALYTDWTFQESLRRTLLTTFMFTQLQSLMRADFTTLITPAPFSSSPTPSPSPSSPSSSLPPTCASVAAVDVAAIKRAIHSTPYTNDCNPNPSKTHYSNDEIRCDSRMLLCRSFTLSAHLWDARDPISFAIAWRDRRHLVVRPWSVWRRLDDARPDEIDKLGRILMTAGMGIEETKGWFVAKGGVL